MDPPPPPHDMRSITKTASYSAPHFYAQIGFGAVVSNDPDDKTSPRGLDISGSTFKGNTGGAVATFNTNVDVKDSIFIDNDGAVYFGTSDLEHGFKLWVSRNKIRLRRQDL